MSFEDINGYEETQKKKRNALNATANEPAKTLNFMTSQDLKHVTMDDFALPKISTPHQEATQSMPDVSGANLTKKFVQTKTFMKDDAKLLKTYDMRLKKTDVDPHEPVYIYGGQKNNWYEKQMRDIRDKIQNDGKALYTYSKDYLGLSIDPKTLDE